MRQLTSLDVIRELLASFLDARDALDKGNDLAYSGQKDSVALLMGPLWNEGSYPQLERALRELRVVDNLTYWHVRERYLKGGSRRIIGCRECGRPAPSFCPGCGKQSPWVDDRGIVCGSCRQSAPKCPVSHRDGAARVRVPVGWVSVPAENGASLSAVLRGVEWLDLWFKQRGLVPFLPREIYEGLAA